MFGPGAQNAGRARNCSCMLLMTFKPPGPLTCLGVRGCGVWPRGANRKRSPLPPCPAGPAGIGPRGLRGSRPFRAQPPGLACPLALVSLCSSAFRVSGRLRGLRFLCGSAGPAYPRLLAPAPTCGGGARRESGAQVLMRIGLGTAMIILLLSKFCVFNECMLFRAK